MDASVVESLMLSDEERVTHTSYGDSTYVYDCWSEWTELDYRDKTVEIPGLGVVSAAEFDTGGEGHGEDIYMVFEVDLFDDHDEKGVRYYRVDGYYASFAGSEWDGHLYEVQPVERLVTFYEKVA